MDMQHGHALRTFSMDIQHELAAWTSSMDMQQGHAPWIQITGMQVSISKTCSMVMQQEHDMEHGHAALTWACITEIQHGHAALAWA
jgi:hypothetical protein